MKIVIDGKTVELNNRSSVFDALDAIKVDSETVLVKRSGKLIPHDSAIKNGDKLETITVISGG